MLKRIVFILLIMSIFLSYSYSEGSELKISVKTKTYNGKYWKKDHVNVTVLWIENAQGKLVQTLKGWGSRHKDKLYEWQEKLGDIDARTSPTRKRHGLIELTWDLTDYQSKKVPAGEYYACIEMSEDNDKGKGKVHRVKFNLGEEPINIINNDSKYFKNFTIKYTP